LSHDVQQLQVLQHGQYLCGKRFVQFGVFASTTPIVSGDGLAFDVNYERLYIFNQGRSAIQVFDVKDVYRSLDLWRKL